MNENDKKKVLVLYKALGCKWKSIAGYFEKRSDNFIKNQFFGIIYLSVAALFY